MLQVAPKNKSDNKKVTKIYFQHMKNLNAKCSVKAHHMHKIEILSRELRDI